MEEIIYRLLLTGAQGLTLFGTLRLRVLPQLAATLDGALPSAAPLAVALAAAQPLGTATFVAVPLQGTLSVPLLTGLRSVPLNGVLLLSPAAGLAYDMSSADPARPLLLKFNNLDGVRIAGGVSWRPGDPVLLALSLLGTRLQLPL